MNLLFKVLAFTLLLGISEINLSYSQGSISGRITDQQTGAVLTQASIYFPELHRGTNSDLAGNFSIANLPQTGLLLQVSYVGYKTFVQTILFKSDTVLTIQLVPSTLQMEELVVTGQQVQPADATSFTISTVSSKNLAENGSLNVADGLAALPGISQLTTGPGISKPVIRGLYGNRIQVNLNGVRFDNQQWQDEHGLGLSTSGIERIEIIRGPASVLYGSDAMGGVVNIIEERAVATNTSEQELNTRLYSNTYGFSVEYASKKASDRKWRNLRISADNHADYSDGKNSRVLNSRFAAYNFKESWGRIRTDRTHILNLLVSNSLFGFVFDEIGRKEEDGRWSRSFDGPHHQVSFAQLTNENTFYKTKYKITFNNGFTSNLRLEDEGGGGISLSMLLNTLSSVLQAARIKENTDFVFGLSGLFQTNTNFGGRIIVPDALVGEFSGFSFIKKRFSKIVLEAGVRYDRKLISTYATNSLNVVGNDSPTQEIVPFTNNYGAGNFSVGSVYNFSKSLSLRGNISSGYRPGNLAELSSNGLHEGTLRWEIGKPDAAIEQNVNAELSLNVENKSWNVSASYYHNQFRNYFYLEPTGTEYYGFLVYQYQQTDALLKGGELNAAWNPAFFKQVNLGLTYGFIEAKQEGGSYLPFIPANKWTTDLTIRFPQIRVVENPYLKVTGKFLDSQSKPAQFETPTPAYGLLDVAIGTGYKNTTILLTCTNVLDKQYVDHLSRYKYYGISNMGRNIILNLTIKL